jgi:hypothetical protein
MDVQPVSLNSLLVTCHRLHRQRVEVLDLRAKLASLEKPGVGTGSGSNKQETFAHQVVKRNGV